MKYFILLTIAISFNGLSQDTISRIAFGSCANQNKPMPVFGLIAIHQPDLFIFLGDNIYGDTEKMHQMKKKYKKLAQNSDFNKVHNSIPIIATWDDHDFGVNDGGRHYRKKEKSKKLFLEFFNEPKESPRRMHEGIYTSYNYQVNGKKLQIILLDLRTFRDDLVRYTGPQMMDSLHFYDLEYAPQTNPDSTMLGAEQWKWLEEELKKPADIRIIGSSTQFATEYNGYETWANFPVEQQRMLDLIKSTQAKGVFFISGDVHYSELSKIESNDLYPIYDLTASGLTEEWKFATPNYYRVGEPVMDNHFGLIEINWNAPVIEISLEIWDVHNQLRIRQVIPLSELQ